jgi:hypothetical protein
MASFLNHSCSMYMYMHSESWLYIVQPAFWAILFHYNRYSQQFDKFLFIIAGTVSVLNHSSSLQQVQLAFWTILLHSAGTVSFLNHSSSLQQVQSANWTILLHYSRYSQLSEPFFFTTAGTVS